MSDENERSVASDGSVGEPVAYQAVDEYGRPFGYAQIILPFGQWPKSQRVPLYRQPASKAVRLPQAPDDFEISEANGYAAAIVDFKRALTKAGIEWTE